MSEGTMKVEPRNRKERGRSLEMFCAEILLAKNMGAEGCRDGASPRSSVDNAGMSGRDSDEPLIPRFAEFTRRGGMADAPLPHGQSKSPQTSWTEGNLEVETYFLEN